VQVAEFVCDVSGLKVSADECTPETGIVLVGDGWCYVTILNKGLMQYWEGSEGYAGVDMVSQVVAGVERSEPEHGQAVLFDVVSGAPTVRRTLHPTVFGDCSQSVEHPPDGHVGHEPKQDPELGSSSSCEQREHYQLSGHSPGAVLQCPEASKRPEQWSEVLVPADKERVAGEFAPHRFPPDRVERIQQHVGFVWSELVSVVSCVGASIGVAARTEGQPSKDPLPNEVVQSSVAEQKAVSCFVIENREPREHRTHE